MRLAIIGGGAAGFFSAISAAINFHDSEIEIFEKSQKLLSKVRISGGGRCNVTNAETSFKKLSEAYPRGGKMLKKLLPQFSTKDTIKWFESRGVPLMVQEDQCVFPVSQDSQSIIDCFLNECKKYNIKIYTGRGVELIVPSDKGISIHFKDPKFKAKNFDKVIVATGGSPKRSGLEWLASLGLKIENPVPSLFTFNMPSEDIKKLMGIVVKNAIVSIQGTKLNSTGPLLITHWGMSGPVILKLSAFGARILEGKNYQFNVNVNWVDETNYEKVFSQLSDYSNQHPNKSLANIRAYYLPERLWLFLLNKCGFSSDHKWGDLGKKRLNKLADILTHDVYKVSGKTTFKQEFVTCGGISLDNINQNSMSYKHNPNLYFAGEVLDVDGITGGYNFQSCWTTGFIAGQLT